jgi:hypothetical protein
LGSIAPRGIRGIHEPDNRKSGRISIWLAAYLVFFFTFLYAIGFVGGMMARKATDTGAVVPQLFYV